MNNKTVQSIVLVAKRVFALRSAVLLGAGVILITTSGCSSNKQSVADTPAGVKNSLTPKPVPADWLAQYNAASQARTAAMRQAFWKTGNPYASTQTKPAPGTTTNP